MAGGMMGNLALIGAGGATFMLGVVGFNSVIDPNLVSSGQMMAAGAGLAALGTALSFAGR